MILNRLLLIVILFNYSITFAQNFEGKVTFRASIAKDKIVESINENVAITGNVKKRLISDVQNATDIHFLLLFNSRESIYFQDDSKNMTNDGIQGTNFTRPLSKYSHMYYKNLDTNELLMQNYHYDKILVIQKTVDWELTQETKEIGPYKCFKAIGVKKVERSNKIEKEEIIAWYTPEIPVSFGIQNLHGLPGLMLELNVGEKLKFKVISIELNPKEKIEIEKPKGKIVSEEKYNEVLKSFRQRYNR